MADHRTLTFYPPPDGRFDLMAGLTAWMDHGGRFWGGGLATVLDPFDPETHLEPTIRGSHVFNPADLETLRPIVERHDVMFELDATWFTVGIQAESYHHADPPIMFWSFDPFLWGKRPGGLKEADG